MGGSGRLIQVVFFLVLLGPLSSFGGVEDQYLSKKQQFLKKEVQNRNILSDLYKAQFHIKKLSNDKSKAQQKLVSLERQIDEISPMVESAEESLMTQKIQIQKRLKYILKFQDMSFLKIVFSSQTPSQMDRNLRILKGLTEMDYVNIKSYFKNVKTLVNKKNDLLSKKQEHQGLMLDLEQKEQDLANSIQSKNKMLQRLSKSQKDLLSNLKKMRKENKAISAERQQFLDTLFEPLFLEKQGALFEPVSGKLLQSYGVFQHPHYKTQFRHKGIFIRPRSTTSHVVSVSNGKVVFVSDDMAREKTVILDHGDHYYSVYSYLEEISVRLGDVISENQSIGRLGGVHPFLGKGLYFELRHFSEPIDPTSWFSKKLARK